tara:strand:+ start:396 stop:1391 length:996 start_codon:yes stop_codon:yes gene_type:complete
MKKEYRNKNYWTYVKNIPHGIMFHHFHDDGLHKRGQGSITKDELYKIIKFIGRKNILNADEFLIRAKENKLKSKNICLTFDDGIKCQHDIALPVLADLEIKGFFFIYSSIFTGKPDLLEIYRYFRMNYFKDINEFYKKFYEVLNKNLDNFFKIKSNEILKLKKRWPHYSIEDLKFRHVRDLFINKFEYRKIMFKLFKEFNFKPKDYYNKLFLNKKELRNIYSLGHLIGLHSHSHPTKLKNLPLKTQNEEYKKNIKILSTILKIKTSEIKSMSHPCGSYNKDTLRILDKMNIELGFNAHMEIEREMGMKKNNNSLLEISRKDHSEIFRIFMN